MKKLLFLGALGISSIAFSQVGINQDQPKATLHIDAINTDGSTTEGVIIPRLAKSALANMGADVEESTTVYVNDIDAVTGGTPETVIHVREMGFYSFLDGVWRKHEMESMDKDLDKNYVCTENNLGQILYTATGYFECANSVSIVDEGVVYVQEDEPKWKYEGLMEGTGYIIDSENGGNQIPVKLILRNKSFMSDFGSSSNMYTLNGEYWNDLRNQYGNEYYPTFVGFSSKIPAVGLLSFMVDPPYVCGKKLYFHNNDQSEITGKTYFVPELLDGLNSSASCPQGEDYIKINLVHRYITYRIFSEN